MSNVDHIRRLESRRSRSEDILEEREDRLYRAVMPVFRAATGATWALELYALKITDTDIVAEFGHPNDGPNDPMSLPHSVFESDNPKEAAAKFQKVRVANEEKNERMRERKRLLRRLENLDDDTDHDDQERSNAGS